MKLDKKSVTITLALTFGFTYASLVPQAIYAKTRLQSIQDQSISQQSLSTQLSVQQKAFQAEVSLINRKQLEITGQISRAQEQINTTNDQIFSLQNETREIQKRIDGRKQLLNKRLVSIYKNGGSVKIIDFLLGSKSFGNFIDRAGILNSIIAQDQKIITDQQNDQKAVQLRKQYVVKKNLENVAKMQELKNNLAEITALQTQKAIAANVLNDKQTNISKKLSTFARAAVSLQNAKSSPASSVKSVSYSYSSDQPGKNNASPNSVSSNSTSSFNLSASVSSGGISGILNYGNQFISRSTYVWGAENPSSGQFDCSGFVQAAFAANGIRIGRTTWEQVKEGSPVSYSNAKPGDIVFFDTDGVNGHDGIYLGGGRFIGSQGSTGVAIVSMDNPYWKSHFRGVVRRILN
jgi:Uncharacterized protein conserved in bacteria